MDNVALHFGKRCIVANDFFRLNAPQHLVVSSHEPLFLILAVVVFGRHVGGDSHHTAFFDPVKAEIERGFIAPVDGGNDPEPFGCPVSAAPTIAKYIIRTWKNPVISMVLAQQARGFIPFRYDN